MFKKAKVKKVGKIIKIDDKYFLDSSVTTYGIDENIEIFLKVLFEGL